MNGRPLHILLLTARDVPDLGLNGQLERWLEAGHRITAVAGSRHGAPRVEHPAPNLTVHRIGSPRTVLPRAAWAVRRGLGRDADVVLEVIDGAVFFTPLWWFQRTPRVALLLAVHRYHDREATRRRRLATLALEYLPLRFLYRGAPILARSIDARDALRRMGVDGTLLQLAVSDAAAERVTEMVGASSPGADLVDRPDTASPSRDATLDALQMASERPRVSLRAELRASETIKATGLAAATLVSNAIQLIFTIVFTRLLGGTGYGSLAALVSAFTILLVGGQALQVAAARETALHHLGDPQRLSATVMSWTQRLVALTVVLAVIGAVLGRPIGHIIGVPEHPFAAGAILPSGVLWMLLSLQRGVLQGLHVYAPVGWSLIAEALGRLVGGGLLFALSLGVTGAFLGTPLELIVVATWMGVLLRRRLGTGAGEQSARGLLSLAHGAWAPIAGLALLALLQNVDLIVVKHRVGGDAAGSYAAGAVAAKAVVWVAIGIALHLLPEATRRAAAGLDPLPVLHRAFAVLGVIAVPALLIFAAVPHLLLRVAFGPDLTQASSALVVLGLAMTLLAVTYLTVQYMLALGRTSFLWVLGAIALIEPLVLSAGDYTLLGYAALVLMLQGIAALVVLVLGLRARAEILASR